MGKNIENHGSELDFFSLRNLIRGKISGKLVKLTAGVVLCLKLAGCGGTKYINISDKFINEFDNPDQPADIVSAGDEGSNPLPPDIDVDDLPPNTYIEGEVNKVSLMEPIYDGDGLVIVPKLNNKDVLVVTIDIKERFPKKCIDENGRVDDRYNELINDPYEDSIPVGFVKLGDNIDVDWIKLAIMIDNDGKKHKILHVAGYDKNHNNHIHYWGKPMTKTIIKEKDGKEVEEISTLCKKIIAARFFPNGRQKFFRAHSHSALAKNIKTHFNNESRTAKVAGIQ
jgi:hypothetical protein